MHDKRRVVAVDAGWAILAPMTDADIRVAEPDEWPAILASIREAYAPWVAVIGREPYPATADYRPRIAAGDVLVVDGPGGIAGVLVVEDRDGTLLLESVSVVPGAQGRGLGRRLMEHAADVARARGHGRVRLYTNAKMARNMAMYEALGYREVERTRERGFDRVYMELQLAEAASASS